MRSSGRSATTARNTIVPSGVLVGRRWIRLMASTMATDTEARIKPVKDDA